MRWCTYAQACPVCMTACMRAYAQRMHTRAGAYTCVRLCSRPRVRESTCLHAHVHVRKCVCERAHAYLRAHTRECVCLHCACAYACVRDHMWASAPGHTHKCACVGLLIPLALFRSQKRHASCLGARAFGHLNVRAREHVRVRMQFSSSPLPCSLVLPPSGITTASRLHLPCIAAEPRGRGS